jgi:hypothetical protein
MYHRYHNTGVNYTSGKFATVINDTGGNIFATGTAGVFFNDTGGKYGKNIILLTT